MDILKVQRDLAQGKRLIDMNFRVAYPQPKPKLS